MSLETILKDYANVTLNCFGLIYSFCTLYFVSKVSLTAGILTLAPSLFSHNTVYQFSDLTSHLLTRSHPKPLLSSYDLQHHGPVKCSSLPNASLLRWFWPVCPVSGCLGFWKKTFQHLIVLIFFETFPYFHFQWKGSFWVVAIQLLSHVQFFVTPWTGACQASLSFTISWSLLKLMSIGLGASIHFH